MQKCFPLSCLAFAVCQAVNQPADAGTINVNDDCTLIEAIISANTDRLSVGCSAVGALTESDQIYLPANALITLSAGYNDGATGLPFITSTIVVQGNDAILERSDTTANNFRLAAVTGSGSLELNDVTLRGANLQANGQGSALYVGANANASLNRVTVTNNFDADTNGSATIFNNGGIVLLNNSVVSNNVGRAVTNNPDGLLVVVNSTLQNNIDDSGAAIYNHGSAQIRNSDIIGNSATNRGGAIYSPADSTTKVTDSNLTANSANSYGGAIFSSGFVTLDGVTISNGSAPQGGGLFAATASQFTLTNALVSNNSAGVNGGGLHIRSDSTVSLSQGSRIDNNVAAGTLGGGVFLRDNGQLDLLNSTVNGNQAADGGGLHTTDGAQVMIVASVLAGNTASDDGGAVFSIGSSDVTIVDSQITNSVAGDEGGGLFIAAASYHSVRGTTLSGNLAVSDGSIGAGGAIHTVGSGRVALSASTLTANSADVGGAIALNSSGNSIVNSTISSNSANQIGGLALVNDGAAVINHSTFTGNSSGNFRAGGVYVGTTSSLTISNSLIAGNTALEPVELSAYGSINNNGGNLFGTRSLASMQALGGFSLVATDVNATSDGDGVSQHLPASLAQIITPLGRYGGSTLTHVPVVNSPALDNALAAQCTDFDQRDEPRNPPVGGFCDIGAVEGVEVPISCFVINSVNDRIISLCL